MQFVSTTKVKKIAAVHSNKKVEIADNDFPIYFTIEANIDYFTKEDILDLSNISAHKQEEEFLFAPGTIFEILSSKAKSDSLHVHIRLVPLHKIMGQLDSPLHVEEIASNQIIKQLRNGEESITIDKKLKDFAIKELTSELRGNRDLKEIIIDTAYYWQIEDSTMIDFISCLNTTNVERLIIQQLRL